MGLRDRLGLRREEGGARQRAPYDIYGGEVSGWNIVPSLQWPSKKAKHTAAREAELNPLLFSPIYRLATRMGALAIKCYGLIEPQPESGEQLDPTGNVIELPNRMARLLQSDSEMRSSMPREEVPLHPAALLLHKPNPLMHRQALVSGTVAQMLVYRHAAWLKDRNAQGSPPEELWPLPAQHLEVQRDSRAIISGFVLHKGTADERELKLEDVVYFRLMPGFRDWAGRAGPIQALAKVAEYGGSGIDAATELFDSGILSPIWIDTHGKTLSDRNQKRLQRQMDAARRNRYSIPVMEDGHTLETLGDGPSDELLARSIQGATDIIRETFGIPKDGDLKAFYAEAVQPIADAIEQELVRSLFSEWEDRPAFAEFQYRDILRGSPAERIELHQKAILSGQETLDEARRDENRPPLPDGVGQVAFVPLNVLPVSTAQETQERPPADSGDGLGGDEGKGTFPSATDEAPTAAMGVRSRWRQGFENRWGIQRDRTIERQSQAYERQARGLLKAELRDIRKALNLDGGVTRAGVRQGEVGGYPEGSELVAIIRESEPAMAEELERFMVNTGELSYRQAAEILTLELLDIDRILRDTLAERAEAVAARFTEVRVDAMTGLLTQGLEEGWNVRTLDTAIAERYTSLATHFVDGIGRTEMAFAYERAAYGAWLQGGVQELSYVFGGGPCTTGMCEEAEASGNVRLGEELPNAGASFDQTLTPPLHPGCTCFMVPFVEEARAAGA